MTKSNKHTLIKMLSLAWVFVVTPLLLNAQNAIRHYTNNSTGGFAPTNNRSMDYITGMLWGDGYLLSGAVLTANVGVYNNVGPSGAIPRFQLLALDSNNQTQWVKTYIEAIEDATVSGGLCATLSIAFTVADAKQTSDGGFIVCGSANKTADISNCSFVGDFHAAFVLKTDQNGTPQWYRYYRDVTFTSVVEDPTNPNGYQYLLCGGSSDNQALYMFTDAAGVPQVSGVVEDISLYNEVAIADVGGNRYYTFTGWLQGENPQVGGDRLLLTTIDQNATIVISKKYDIGGTWIGIQYPWSFEWVYYPHSFNGTGINDVYDGENVAICANATFWWATEPNGHYQIVDAVIMKVNPLSGNPTWVYRYNETGYENAFMASSIAVKPSTHDIAITGLRYQKDDVGHLNTTGAMYLETDLNGVVNREVTYQADLAFEGKAIVRNSNTDYFAYSGNVSDRSYSIRNNYGFDCDPDQWTSRLYLDNEMTDVSMQNTNVLSSISSLVEVDLPYSDFMPCGVLKPAPSTTAEVTKDAKFTLAPNPTAGVATLSFSNLQPYNKAYIKVTDMLGQVVFTKHLETNQQEGKVDIDLGNKVASGQYIVAMYCDNVQVAVQRLSVVK